MVKRNETPTSNKQASRRAMLRRALLAALLLAAGALAYLRWEVSAPPAPAATPAPTLVPQDGRTAREAAYDKDVAALQALIRDESAAQDVRTQAAQRLSDLTSEHQDELAVETALRAAGYGACTVIMRNGSLTILTPGAVDATQSAAILSLCAAHTDVPAENVRIMSASGT